MTTKHTPTKDPLKIRNYSITGAVIWTVLLVFLLLYSIDLAKEHGINHAYIYTKVGFDKDVLYRHWVAEHGGVYVKVDSATPPNPYLSHIPDRDIIVDSNIQFTLMNPAYMTRQVYELQEKLNNVRGHITSLKPVRPENAPDEWEIKALQLFEQGEKEYYERTTIDGVPYFRYMKPFITEQSCLKCHAQHGYVLNDIRGGISTSYPLALVDSETNKTINRNIVVYSLLWLFGILGIVLSYFRLKKSNAKRLMAEASLLSLNENLEQQIEDRSRELLKSRQDWERIFNTLKTPAQLIDKNHVIRYVNDATLEAFVKTREDFIGQKCHKLFHLSDTPPANCPLLSALNENKSISNEMHMEVNKTTYIVSCSPIYDTEGNIDHFMHIMTDISDRKEMELNLSHANTIINRSPAVAFRWKNEEGWPVEFVTENVELLTGYSDDEYKTGQIQYSQIIHQEDLERVAKEVSDNSNGNKNQFVHQPYRIITKNREVKWVNDITFIQRNISRNITHFEGIVIDITNKQLALKALQESDERSELFFSQSLDGFFFMMLDEPVVWNDSIDKEETLDYIFHHQRITKANKAVLEQYEADEEEFIGRTPADLFSHDLKKGRQVWKDLFDRGQLHIDTHEKTFKGKEVIFEGDYVCMYDSQKRITGHFGIQRDITSVRKAAEDLAKYRLRLEDLVKERTKELQEKNMQLEQINKLFIGRELRMAELKEKIDQLESQIKQTPKQ